MFHPVTYIDGDLEPNTTDCEQVTLPEATDNLPWKKKKQAKKAPIMFQT